MARLSWQNEPMQWATVNQNVALVVVKSLTSARDAAREISVAVMNIVTKRTPLVKDDNSRDVLQEMLTLKLALEGVKVASEDRAPVEMTVKGKVTVSGTVKDLWAPQSTKGGALNVKVGEGGRLVLSHASFEKCAASATGSTGGAVYLDLSGGDTREDEAVLKLESVTFGTGSNVNAAESSKDMFIKSKDEAQVADADLGFATNGAQGSVSLQADSAPAKDITAKGSVISEGGEDDDGLPAGAIVGIVVGCVAVVGIIVVAIILVVLKKKGKICTGKTKVEPEGEEMQVTQQTVETSY